MVTYDDIEARQAGWLAWQAGLKNNPQITQIDAD
jgi:6-phosphofructokinase